MHPVSKPASLYSYFLAQEQEFVRHTLKLIIGFFKVISHLSSKLDHSKDIITNPKDYKNNRISTFHLILFNTLK